MKTLKSILLSLTLLMACSFANASTQPAAAVLTKNDVLNIYVNAVVHGKIEGLENILAKDVKYTMYRGDKEFNLDKKQLLASFKASENVEQACTYVTSVMDETNKDMVVKVILRYDGYVRTNLVTIAQDHDDFRITKIETQS